MKKRTSSSQSKDAFRLELLEPRVLLSADPLTAALPAIVINDRDRERESGQSLSADAGALGTAALLAGVPLPGDWHLPTDWLGEESYESEQAREAALQTVLPVDALQAFAAPIHADDLQILAADTRDALVADSVFASTWSGDVPGQGGASNDASAANETDTAFFGLEPSVSPLASGAL